MALIHTLKKIGSVTSDKKFYIPAAILALIIIIAGVYIAVENSQQKNAEAKLLKDYSEGRYLVAIGEGRALLLKNHLNVMVAEITAKSYIRYAALTPSKATASIDTAVLILSDVVRKYPSDPELLAIFAYAYLTKHLDQPAQTYAQHAISISKGGNSLAWTVLAHIDEKKADPTKAAFDYQAALRADPMNVEAGVGQINIVLRQGKSKTQAALAEAKKLAAAGDAYEKSLAYQTAGWIYMSLNNQASRQEAASDFVAALKLSPGLIPSMGGYGIMLGEKLEMSPVADMKAAMSELVQRGNIIVTADPESFYGYAVLAEAYNIGKDKTNYAKNAALVIEKLALDNTVPEIEKSVIRARYGITNQASASVGAKTVTSSKK